MYLLAAARPPEIRAAVLCQELLKFEDSSADNSNSMNRTYTQNCMSCEIRRIKLFDVVEIIEI
jgi:hypothetical protein